jgi:hypothetical protein
VAQVVVSNSARPSERSQKATVAPSEFLRVASVVDQADFFALPRSVGVTSIDGTFARFGFVAVRSRMKSKSANRLRTQQMGPPKCAAPNRCGRQFDPWCVLTKRSDRSVRIETAPGFAQRESGI